MQKLVNSNDPTARREIIKGKLCLFKLISEGETSYVLCRPTDFRSDFVYSHSAVYFEEDKRSVFIWAVYDEGESFRFEDIHSYKELSPLGRKLFTTIIRGAPIGFSYRATVDHEIKFLEEELKREDTDE